MILAVRLFATFMSSGKSEYIASGTGMTFPVPLFCNLMEIKYFYTIVFSLLYKNSLFYFGGIYL